MLNPEEITNTTSGRRVCFSHTKYHLQGIELLPRETKVLHLRRKAAEQTMIRTIESNNSFPTRALDCH